MHQAILLLNIVRFCLTFGDRRSSSDSLCPVVRDVATIEDAISESGTYSYAKNEFCKTDSYL